MRPVIPEGSRHRAALNDLAFDLTRKSAGFRRSLPRPIQAPLANLVRAMNCYYSNLIEGHDTHPLVGRARARVHVQQYKTMLANCDSTRGNDLDGRRVLSEEALAEFTRFFLTVCIDQVDFTESLPCRCLSR